LKGEYRMSNKECRMTKEKSESEKKGRSFDLEDRLIDFTVGIIKVAESAPKSRAGNHKTEQG